MTINDPIVITGLGVILAAAGWIVRTVFARLDKRIATLETHVGALQTQMAAHDGIQDSIKLIFAELRTLSGLTYRIAGHLKIN